MKLITVYEATGPYDTIEGRMPGEISYGIYKVEQDAVDAASDKGVMGTPGTVKARTAVLMESDLFYVIDDKAPTSFSVPKRITEELRKSGLAKLTSDEKKALGIK